MTPAEHYALAEQLLRQADQAETTVPKPVLLAAAQVHALLALVPPDAAGSQDFRP